MVWQQCSSEAFKWITQGLKEPVFSSLTVYNRLRSRFAAWSMSTSLSQRFGLMMGHGILDRYLRNYWQLVRARNPSVPPNDVELQISPIFSLPGVPAYRDDLLKGFHPPVILFADGKAWLDGTNWEQQSLKLEDDLISLGAMMGAAMALSGEFDKNWLMVKCPHTPCPWHRSALCWKVPRFPDKPESCIMPNLYRTQMNIDLPTDKGWNAGQIDRPIVKEHEQLLALELD